jgi:GntR family transcriptional regulator, phosphonate transport system regulatory protein
LNDALVTSHPQPSEAAALPLWKRIADDLAQAIARGEFAPGTALPTAMALAERYGVHRHTVRQAFHHLAEQGQVSVVQGRGTYVTQPRFPYKIGRRVSFRGNFGAAGLAASSSLLESSIIAAPPAVANALAILEGTLIWRIRSLNEAGGRPMSTSLHYLEEARFPALPAQLRSCEGSFTRAFASYGIARYERLSTRLSARAATQLEARLLILSNGAPVLHSSSLDGTEDGRPIQLNETAFAGDRMEMVVEPEG